MNIADETLSLKQVQAYLPIIAEASRLQGSLCNGGALHIILEDGNYGDDCVAYCVEFIESGAYAKEQWCDHKEIANQLAFARALVPLTEQQREMVCEGKTATERLFDLVMNHVNASSENADD
jgi:GAF domain-containing protein